MNKLNSQRGAANVLAAAVIVIFFLVIIGGIMYFYLHVAPDQLNPVEPVVQTNPVTSTDNTSGGLITPVSVIKDPVAATPPGPVSFTLLAQDTHSGHADRKDYVIATAADWKKLWDMVQKNVTPKKPLPTVDFKKEIVLATFSGGHATGGYTIAVTGVQQTATTVEVSISETKPGAGALVTEEITAPYSIVKIATTDKSILFKH